MGKQNGIPITIKLLNKQTNKAGVQLSGKAFAQHVQGSRFDLQHWVGRERLEGSKNKSLNDIVEMVECLLSKLEALSSNSSTFKKNNKKPPKYNCIKYARSINCSSF
jgi:hypothetical protein